MSWPLVVRNGQYFSLNIFLTLTPTPNLFPTANTAPSTMILVACQFDNDDDDDGCRCKDKNDDSCYIQQQR